MEIAKATSILLFFVSSTILSPFFAQAICVPRNTSSYIIISPAAAPASVASAPDSAGDGEQDAPSPTSSHDVPSSSIAALPFPFPRSPNPVLKLICDKTEHSKECIDSVSSSVGGELNPTSVLKMEIQALHKSFKAGLDLAHSLYYGASSDLKNSLDVCLDVYDSGVSDTDTSLSAIVTQDSGTLNSMLSAAVDYSDTCDDAFDETGADAVLKDTNQMLGILASNCLAISELLPWN